MKRLIVLAAFIVASLGLASLAVAAAGDTVRPITFEPPTYAPGDINAQDGWMKTGSFDAAVASVASFPAAARYGFGAQALRLSDSVTSGSFGDQTFSPGLASPAGESASKHFDASFQIGAAVATEQSGLHMSVSPDNGSGGRMSYLRFEDQLDGVHVFFDDVTDAGPLGTVATFNETDITTLSRTSAHAIRFSIDFKNGPGNDRVKIFIDGRKKATGTTWEDYYRYDPEAAGSGNLVPSTSKLIFRESGDANPLNAGNGFLVDGVTLTTRAQDNDDNDGHDGHDGDDGGHGGHHDRFDHQRD
jgi:hypothetical protein